MYVTARRSSRRTKVLKDRTAADERESRDGVEEQAGFLIAGDNGCEGDTNTLLKYSVERARMMKPSGSQRKLLLISINKHRSM